MLEKVFPKVHAYLSRGALEIAGWDVGLSGALRKGVWKGVDTLPEALDQTNIEIARLGDITKEDRVLDAGCGLGSTCLYLSKTIGCRTVGISINENECKAAIEKAHEAGLSDLASFEPMDFTKTRFEDGSFDIVLAIESVTWLDDKSDFLVEANRLLVPGGRLVVIDQFKASENPGPIARKVLTNWSKGYSGFKLTTIDRFSTAAAASEFSKPVVEEWTKYILPSSRILAGHAFRWAIPDFILGKLFRFKGSRKRRAFFASSRAEYLAFRFGPGRYNAILLQKQ